MQKIWLELEILYAKMAREAMIVLQPLLFFFVAFDENMAHNMLALMLNPRYRGM
jgi:hypothetical protein